MTSEINDLRASGLTREAGYSPENHPGKVKPTARLEAVGRGAVSRAESRSLTDGVAQSTAKSPDIREVVSDLNDYVQRVHRELRFSVDEGTGRVVVSVINSETDKVIRQIPRDEVLAMVEQLHDKSGIVFSAKA